MNVPIKVFVDLETFKKALLPKNKGRCENHENYENFLDNLKYRWVDNFSKSSIENICAAGILLKEQLKVDCVNFIFPPKIIKDNPEHFDRNRKYDFNIPKIMDLFYGIRTPFNVVGLEIVWDNMIFPIKYFKQTENGSILFDIPIPITILVFYELKMNVTLWGNKYGMETFGNVDLPINLICGSITSSKREVLFLIKRGIIRFTKGLKIVFEEGNTPFIDFDFEPGEHYIFDDVNSMVGKG